MTAKQMSFLRILLVCLGISSLLAAGFGCGGKKNSSAANGDKRLTEFSKQLEKLPGAITPVTKPILAEDGIIIQIANLLEMDLSTKKGRQAYRDAANKISEQVSELRQPASTLLWEAYKLDAPYNSFLKSQADGFPPEEDVDEGESGGNDHFQWKSSTKDIAAASLLSSGISFPEAVPQQSLRPGASTRLIGTALVATGVIIAVYKTYTAIDSAVNKNNEIVMDTARSCDSGRKEVIRQLNKRGADLSKNASDEEIKEAFDSLNTSTRMSVSREVRSWVAEDLAGREDEEGDQAVPVLETDKERYVEVANELGKVAVETTVDGMMQVTGGVGSALENVVGGQTGKLAGAATDLTLQITEKDPISLVKQKSIVVATGPSTLTTVEAPVNPMTREETEKEMEKIAGGRLTEADKQPGKIRDVVGNLLRWHLDDQGITMPTGENISLSLTAPDKFTVTEAALQPDPSSDEDSPAFSANFPLWGFLKDAWGYAHLLLSTPGAAPAETDLFINDDKATAEMNLIPLSGTIKMTATPLEPKQDDSQKFLVTVKLLHHYDETSVSLDATQALISGSRVLVRQPGIGELNWEVTITGTSQMVARRHDTGESLSKTVRFAAMPGQDAGEEEEDPPVGSAKCLDWIRDHSGTYESFAGGWRSDCDDGSTRVIYGELDLTITGTNAELTYHRKERFDCHGLNVEDENYTHYPDADMTVSGKFVYKKDECRLQIDASTATDPSLLEEFYVITEDKTWGSGNTLRPGGDGLIVNPRMNENSYLICEDTALFSLRCDGIGACCFYTPEDYPN